MNYETLETDIVARLSPFMPQGVDAVKLPESDADLRGKPFMSGRVTVMYASSEYGDPGANNFLRTTAQVAQLETVTTDVVVQSRFLRGKPDSLHRLVALVKRALTGFMPTDCNRMYLRRQRVVEKLLEQDASDLFTCVLEFECTTLNVEEFDSTTGDGAPISQVQFDSNHGQFQVP